MDKKKIPYYSCIKELNIDDNKLYFLNNKDYGNENDNSSVIYTKINNHKFLFMGDAGVEVEQDLIEKYNLKDTDVLKVGYHGSKTSTGKEFVGVINPKYSIISVGKNNRYGHTNKEVINVLENSKIYRTDIDGNIIFKIKNNREELVEFNKTNVILFLVSDGVLLLPIAAYKFFLFLKKYKNYGKKPK